MTPTRSRLVCRTGDQQSRGIAESITVKFICAFCDSDKPIVAKGDKCVCKPCLQELKRITGRAA